MRLQIEDSIDDHPQILFLLLDDRLQAHKMLLRVALVLERKRDDDDPGVADLAWHALEGEVFGEDNAVDIGGIARFSTRNPLQLHPVPDIHVIPMPDVRLDIVGTLINDGDQGFLPARRIGDRGVLEELPEELLHVLRTGVVQTSLFCRPAVTSGIAPLQPGSFSGTVKNGQSVGGGGGAPFYDGRLWPRRAQVVVHASTRDAQVSPPRLARVDRQILQGAPFVVATARMAETAHTLVAAMTKAVLSPSSQVRAKAPSAGV